MANLMHNEQSETGTMTALRGEVCILFNHCVVCWYLCIYKTRVPLALHCRMGVEPSQ